MIPKAIQYDIWAFALASNSWPEERAQWFYSAVNHLVQQVLSTTSVWAYENRNTNVLQRGQRREVG
jgi:hypothetical protein